MISLEDEMQVLQSALPEEILEMRRNMRDMRYVYTTPEGLQMLQNLIVSSGVFEKIDPVDQAAAGARNMVIDMLNSMGVICESTLPMLLKAMLGLPLPFNKGGENNESNNG